MTMPSENEVESVLKPIIKDASNRAANKLAEGFQPDKVFEQLKGELFAVFAKSDPACIAAALASSVSNIVTERAMEKHVRKVLMPHIDKLTAALRQATNQEEDES